MKHAWANSLLLVLILVELATGFFGLVSGSADEALFIQAHRVAGYGSLAVIGWKALIIASSLRKPMRLRRAVAPRAASVALLATLAVTLVLGLAWSLAGPFTAGLFSGVSWHIYAGAALVPVLVWYSIHHTRGLPAAFWADRRSFLRLAGAAVAGGGVMAGERAGGRLWGRPGRQTALHRLLRGSAAKRRRLPGCLLAERSPPALRCHPVEADRERRG